jgi:gamma-glutamyl-gamma-aminobutyrate hydrolase PuuD
MYARKCSPNLLLTLEKYGRKFKVARKIEDLKGINVTGLILTGSPFRLTPGHDDKIKDKTIAFAIYCLLNYNVPVLGICFGCQLLNVLHGGTVKVYGRLFLEEVDGLKYNFNDMIDKVGHGFVVKRRANLGGQDVVIHIEKRLGNRYIVGYAFHPESDMDNNGYLFDFFRAATLRLPPRTPV